MKSWTSLKMGHVGSKTMSLGQIIEKPFKHSRGRIFWSDTHETWSKYLPDKAPPRWVSGWCVRLQTWWLRVQSPVEVTFLSGVFLPLTSAEACEKSSRWLWKEKMC